MSSKGEYQNYIESDLSQRTEKNFHKIINPNSVLKNVEIDIDEKTLINFHTNNYLGLFFFPELKELFSYKEYGDDNLLIYSELEKKITTYLKTEATLLYASVFDINGGILEPLFTAQDIILSDELNSFSLMDKLVLGKSKHYRYKNDNLESLEAQLQSAVLKDYRYKIIVTEGVFSMKGSIANLQEICKLAEKYNALVMVDDSHATGFIGKTGRGTHEYNDVVGKVDIIISSLNSDLGGFISGKKEIIDLLKSRQRKEPYLNRPSIEAVSFENHMIEILSHTTTSSDKIKYNSKYLRTHLKQLGFDVLAGESAIVSILLYDDQLSQYFSDRLFEEGINVVNLFYPVVPKGKARILLHISALHTQNHLDIAIDNFTKVGKELGVI